MITKLPVTIEISHDNPLHEEDAYRIVATTLGIGALNAGTASQEIRDLMIAASLNGIRTRLPSTYVRKPIKVEAHQWHKNGDHPDDYKDARQAFTDDNTPTLVTGAEAKRNNWEGAVVRYFRRPDIPGDSRCSSCGKAMHDHGWVERSAWRGTWGTDRYCGGHGIHGDVVCPGDWIVTEDQIRYAVSHTDFTLTYEKA